MHTLNFNMDWWHDDHADTVRGVVTFDHNLLPEEEDHEDAPPLDLTNIKIAYLELPYHRLIAGKDRTAWRSAEPEEIAYLEAHPEFKEDLIDFWIEKGLP